jgi:hypothetical protein
MIIEYYLDSDIVKLCQHFADTALDTNIQCYNKRRQFNSDKIKQDIFIGKLAEWGVFFSYIKRNQTTIQPPDMRIYLAEEKSFDCDLRWGLYKLHVKSQTFESAERYGDSWIFQSKDPLFGYSNEYDIIVGCRVAVDSEGALVQILLEKPFRNLNFSEPKLSKFAGNKKAIYLKDNIDD